MSLAPQMGWKVFQMNVRSAFFNGVLEEEASVNQPAEKKKAKKSRYTN